jgi:hypothetical protein
VVSFGQKSSQRFNPLSGEYEPWVYFVIYVILPLWFFFAIYLNLPSKKEKRKIGRSQAEEEEEEDT